MSIQSLEVPSREAAHPGWQRPMTLSEQILSRAAGRPVAPGDMVVVAPDLVMGHDSLSPSIIRVMRDQLGVDRVFDKDKIAIVLDHVSPASTVGTANNQNKVRAFAREQDIRLFDVGRGICHQVLVEERLARPGMLIFGSDSHSCSYGAVGAFGSGMGTTDIALIWATGKTWVKVPPTLRVQVRGRFRPGVSAKDLALRVCRDLTIAGATYAAIEYHGLDWLPLEGRQTLASMAVEVGAKAGIVPPTGVVAEQLLPPAWLQVQEDAVYEQELVIDLAELEPQVARPNQVDDVCDLSEVAGTDVSVVFLGTCTNGRYEDMRAAARILSGRRIHPNVRLMITPASNLEMQRAMRDDTLSILIDAGATLTTPGCGMCMGRHQGTLGDGDVCLSTGNRNFRGRMGAPSSRIYLASPEVAAATAISGRIAGPEEV
ncbi:3-isopropylmalate dehydratase large subunit [Acanthopleuribacter pedis]|uniref:3-isopropylmalate dehydratase large subunit n=2 Tax=Acanthopleuribacter pedis TaxID=442870 RepID=A0A8J7Q672_9BACT|nr:3-isopropylmalate dehydratase large subunit [Acanthopleuribacter pedis]MBO1321232.1 3-isopropylmalate dehydratase large subunit [Acanthopleuribacter pedis]